MMMVGNNNVHALQRGAKTGNQYDEQVQNLRQLKMENRGIGMGSSMTAKASMGGSMTGGMGGSMTGGMGSMGTMTAMTGGMEMGSMTGGMGMARRTETVADRTRTRVAGIKGGRVINDI